MNRASSDATPAPIRTWRRPHPAVYAAVLAAAWGLGPGCIEIKGGAVEFSWSLRSFDGEAVEACADARIDEVRLCWEPLGDGSIADGAQPCRASQRRAFPCGASSGVTGFVLEPGRTAFWIEPVCADGSPPLPDTYQVPPPIVRAVEEGEIISLNALLVVVRPLRDECTEERPCTCGER